MHHCVYQVRDRAGIARNPNQYDRKDVKEKASGFATSPFCNFFASFVALSRLRGALNPRHINQERVNSAANPALESAS
jgi:hypothetical protein